MPLDLDPAPIRRTESLCAICKTIVPAAVHVEPTGADGPAQVVMHKHCPDHGGQSVVVSSDADWYVRTLGEQPALTPPQTPVDGLNPVKHGCPYDCGPCTAHEQTLLLAVIPITSACNLDCPICYTHNKNDDAFFMTPDALRAILQGISHRGMVNLTGGEPTQHPDLLALVDVCRAEGFHRITLSTHGLRFIKHQDLLAALAERQVRVILSFDSFRHSVNETMLGGRFLKPKMRVLELLEEYRVDTTLLPVLARGLNDDEVGDFVELALRKDFIRSVEFHPMTFTGQSGVNFDRDARYTTYDALADLEKHSAGQLRVDDFVASPAAHPLCYQVTYLLRLSDGRWLPFPRFMERATLRALLATGLYLEPGTATEQILADVVARLWAGDIECADRDLVLAALRDLTDSVYAAGTDKHSRMLAAESRTKAVYIHTHMDEETFDTERMRQCCVGMPEAGGKNTPSCAYNVVYRGRDTRFVQIEG